MDNKKEQERQELHRTIWAIANDLRGSVDGWDFKSYVLGMLFYRYISEQITNYIDNNEHKSGNKSFSYKETKDKDAKNIKDTIVEKLGYFILPSQLFSNVREKADTDEDLNLTLGKIFESIEKSSKGSESENDFSGLFEDVDVDSKKLGSTVKERNKKLAKLLLKVGEMQLGNYEDNTIDAFGDAYEFMMGMYASSAGKSGGEYYTPQEVSELLTRLATYGKEKVNKVYDPACGSGSLLLKTIKVLGKNSVKKGFFGQEINLTTFNLCRINMILHGLNFSNFDIENGDTLTNPLHEDEEPFDVIVSNPPYSIKWVGDDDLTLINDERFAPAGVLAPKSKADMAFIMHSLSYLSTDGAAAIVCFPGIFYRGGAEQKIRKYLIDNNFIDTIIQLPDNLFYGTSIATCIMVLKKTNKSDNNFVFIDASDECIKVTNNNKLTDDNINSIVKYFSDRKKVKNKVAVVPYDTIVENDYNLSVNTYVEKKDTREKIDIDKLNADIKEIVAKEEKLRKEIDKIIEEI